MAKTELFDMISMTTPWDGAVDGKMHPRWDEACAHAEAQMMPIKGTYRKMFPEFPDRHAWVYQFARDAVAIRNKWLADHG